MADGVGSAIFGLGNSPAILYVGGPRMGTESSSTPGAPKTISRRRVVAGAAWSVPAVMVASAAPAVAASPGPLTFSGRACKLPGNSSDLYKGYVFELESDNPTGPPGDTVIQIRNVAVNTAATGFSVDVKTVANECGCTCPGADTDEQFCVSDDTMDTRVLIYTAAEPTGTSVNAEMTLEYRMLDCACTEIQGWTSLSSGVRATPPATPGGGSCEIPDVFPLPTP